MSQPSDRRNPSARTEPTLGALDAHADAPEEPRLRAPERPRRPAASARRARPRAGRWVLVIALVALAALGFSQRDTLRALLPSTQLNEILARADAALAAGELDGNAGASARELYSAARALAPDNERALDGLQSVGKAEFEHARKSFADGRLDAAERALNAARALLGGGSELDALDKDITTRRARGTELDTLLERARQAHSDGRRDSAVRLYRQMLAADAGNAVARHALDGIGNELAADARKALAAGDLAAATQGLAELADILPDQASLPGLRADLAAAQTRRDAERDEHLARADADLAAGRLDGEGGDNAIQHYKAALERDAANVAAHTGLQRVATALLARAESEMAEGRFDAAAGSLESATALAPDSVTLADARARLRDRRKAANSAKKPPAREPPKSTASEPKAEDVAESDRRTVEKVASAEDRARAQALITRAQAAAANGDLMLPPGDCAYDLYRSALALDPDNADAFAGLAGLPATARGLFDDAIKARDPERGAAMLASFSDLAPGSAALADMRARLAASWLARAEQRAGENDAGSARRALGEAERLGGDAAQIAALRQRLGG